MTQEHKSRIEYYVSKTGKLPHYQSFAKDFGISVEEASNILTEYKLQDTSRIRIPKPNEPTGNAPARISQEKYNEIRTNGEQNQIPHESIRHFGGEIPLRIICLLVFLACATRGFSVILDLNGSNLFYGIVSGIIFQGGSAILPVLSFLYFSSKKVSLFLFGIFLLLGGLGSMTYETWASVASFHQMNVKQELSAKEARPTTDDPIVRSLEENIKSSLEDRVRTEELLAQRRLELSLLPTVAPGRARAEARVQANLADLDREASQIQSLQDKKTARLLYLEGKQDSASSALNIVSQDQSYKNGFELFIIIVPSLMMVLFTPIFFGISMFGVGRKI